MMSNRSANEQATGQRDQDQETRKWVSRRDEQLDEEIRGLLKKKKEESKKSERRNG